MKLHSVACAILAMSLTMAGPVFAQGEGNQQRGAERQDQRGDRHQDERNFGQQRGQRGWQQQRQRPQQQERRGDEYRDARGAGPDHGWHRGDRLPPEYRHRNYVVDDWRGHHLNAPPRGYHWVQVGGDYVLVAVATGIIMQLLLNH
ncbi:MAG TPA: RcnB family protein [Ramlibacter sp.]|nr:RcnB family protein [Ramlibacter sp.]